MMVESKKQLNAQEELFSNINKMVIKRVPQVDPESLTKRAKSVKRLSIEFYGIKRNSKKTTEKYLTEDQIEVYENNQEKLRNKAKKPK